MRNALTAVVSFAILMSLFGCGGDGGCGCDLPRRTNDWLIDIDFSHIPDVIAEYPIHVDITVHISHLENGGPAPDGLMVTLTIEPGSFDNGLTELRQPIAGGRVSTRAQIENPGNYTLTIEIPGESFSATATFSVGL